jgi:hypothetical protein
LLILHPATPLADAGLLRTIQQGLATLAAHRRPATNAVPLWIPASRPNALSRSDFDGGMISSRAKRGDPIEGGGTAEFLPNEAIAPQETVVGDERLSCISDNGRFMHRRQRT